MLKKSLIQFSVEGWGCVPSLLFDLRSNYGGGNEMGQWLPLHLPMQGVWVRSLVRELRSHVRRGQKTKHKTETIL